MWKPVPIKKSDIKVGQKCVMVQVNPASKYSFYRFAFADQPDQPVEKNGEWRVRIYRRQERRPQSEEVLYWMKEMSAQKYQKLQEEKDFSSISLVHFGIIPEEREGRYGRYNRTFKATRATMKFFKKLNKESDVLPAWLKFIRINDNPNTVGACIDEAYNA